MRIQGVRFSLFSLLALITVVGLVPDPARAAPAQDGDGILSVSPDSVAYASSSRTFTFTFSAGIRDFGDGSQVAIIVPAGWPAPTMTLPTGLVTITGSSCTLNSTSPLDVQGSTILVDMTSCLAGQSFTLTYSGVTPPGPAGSPYTFVTQTDIGQGGSGLVAIAAGSPAVAVTPGELTVSAAGLTPADRSYDGTTAAALTIGSPTLVGVIGADVVSLDTTGAVGSFTDRNVGTGKTVAISGLALGGADAANYTLTQPTRTASITQRPVTLVALTDSKVYDGTTASSGVPVVAAGTPLAGGDAPGAWTQSFDNRNFGAGKTLTPAGVINDGNGGLNYAYTFEPVVTGVITPRPITVTAVGDSKVYDGTTSSVGVPVLSALTPLAPGDVEPAWRQSFDNNAVGTGKTLTPAGAVNDGNAGLNYAYTFLTDMSGAIAQRDLTVAADEIAKGLGMPDPPLTWRVTAGSLATGDTLALTREPGEAVGAYPITIGSFPEAANYKVTYTGAFLSIGPTVQFVSGGMWDGWVLESSRAGNVGGAVNASAPTVRLGDDAANRQYRAILSFDTSLLPDNAVVQAVALTLRKSGALTGSNPFTTMGNLLVDIRKGSFSSRALTVTDFQATPSAVAVGMVGKTAVSGWHVARFNAVGRSKLNKAGLTQVRLYFQKGDNGNRRADFLSFASGDSASGRPQLTVTYALP